MKGILKVLLILVVSANVNANLLDSINLNFNPLIDPDPRFIKKEEKAWPGAVTVRETIHKKEVEIEFDSFKVTTLGYGAMTPKVISLELAKHTVMDHRNIGEAGPCLAGLALGSAALSSKFPLRETVTIELRNRYDINHEKGVCQVTLEEHVEVEIDGQVFSHLLSKDMGHRFVEDCAISE